MTIEIKKLKPKDFPKRLQEITDPPKELYLRGNLPPENYKYLCVVGSRKHTDYGKEVCQKLISGFRGFPIVIVSGLAIGIDSIAHRSALTAGLKSIGVPGSGLDPKVFYPSLSRQLSENVLEAGGALISEFEPEFKATAWSFPQRNRIMAGLSDAVLVVEAELKSGTLITSRLANEYNREVFTVPGSIFSKNSEGPHMLIRLGATPVTSSKELLEALGFKQEKAEEKSELKYADCSEQELNVVKILGTPMPKDELMAKTNLPIGEINAVLSIMEIKGLIKESMGEIHLV